MYLKKTNISLFGCCMRINKLPSLLWGNSCLFWNLWQCSRKKVLYRYSRTSIFVCSKVQRRWLGKKWWNFVTAREPNADQGGLLYYSDDKRRENAFLLLSLSLPPSLPQTDVKYLRRKERKVTFGKLSTLHPTPPHPSSSHFLLLPLPPSTVFFPTAAARKMGWGGEGKKSLSNSNFSFIHGEKEKIQVGCCTYYYPTGLLNIWA